MAKNLIPRIAEMLGVEMEEAFKIRRPDYEVCENGVYAFFENEGLVVSLTTIAALNLRTFA